MSRTRQHSSSLAAAAVALGLAVVSLTGCSDAGANVDVQGSEDSTEQAMTWTSLPDFLAFSVGSRDRLPFRGVRRIKQYEVDSDGLPELLEILEEVGSDGAGGYTIELLEAIELPSGTDGSLYEVAHARSVDVFWSKRDFRIQDLDLASANYTITHLPQTSTLAGIECEQVEFLRHVAPATRPGRYIVDFDPTTGFVLGWTEFDSAGAPLASSAYEAFSYRPVLSGLTLGGASFAGNSLDLNGSLDDQAGFSVLVPDLLPAGYEVYEVETFAVPVHFIQTGESFLPAGSWARIHATDGIESLSFAHAAVTSGSAGVGDDQLRVLRQGSWDYGFGRASGVPFIVAGRVSTTALRQLVESAVR